MCGLAGVIFGNKRRRAEEREYLAWLFTRLLLLSEERGPHATGAAWLDVDGGHRLFKRPVTAERFVLDKAFAELLAGIYHRRAGGGQHDREGGNRPANGLIAVEPGVDQLA